MSIYSSIVGFFQNGGVFMYPIVLVLAAGLAIAIERWLFLTSTQVKSNKLWAEVTPFIKAGKFNEAVWHLKKALQIEPDQVEPMNNLAWILATNKEDRIREPDEAIRLAEKACELTNQKRPDFLDTLAVAYASAGRFTEAMGTAEEAKALAESLGQKRLAKEIGRRLLLFKAGQPYMESPS